MNEVNELIELLNKKEKLVAMLAPSFPIVYQYPSIIGMLKALGFQFVVEISAGANKTNEEVIRMFNTNPNARIIASPCPSVVRLIRNKYPQLLKYIVLNIDSPMSATARIIKEKWPDHRPVFIGPCVAKKLEAKEDWPELKILVITYKEIDEIFKKFNIEDNFDNSTIFDISFSNTRLYPVSGGLTQSSQIKDLFSDDQIQVVSGWKSCVEALNSFEENKDLRFLDILFCDGGCINGPGINSTLSLEERRNKIIEYQNSNNESKNISGS